MNPFLELPPFNPFGHLNVILNASHQGSYEGGAGEVIGFGMIPGTSSGRGSPLHAVVLLDQLAFAGAVVPSRIIGVGGGCFIAIAAASRLRVKSVEEIHPLQLAEVEELLALKGWRIHKTWQGRECAHEKLVAGLRSVMAQTEEISTPAWRRPAALARA